MQHFEQTLEALAQNPIAQLTVSAGTVGAANAERLISMVQKKTHWYDPFWIPVWNFLPWAEIATVLGVPLVAYSLYVTIKNAWKNKN